MQIERTQSRAAGHRREILSAIVALCALASSARACSVPVFRYALERWPADLFEVDIFYRGALTPAERTRVSQLEDQSLVNGGNVNWEVVLCRTEDDLAEDLQTVRDSLGDVTFPQVVLRRPGGRRGSPIVWQGPLQDATADLWASPARTTLINRLMGGDSVVWLVFSGGHPDRSRKATTLLQTQFPTLAEEISLPQGVGLPGSEVLSRVPLEVRFSVVEVDDRASAERQFRRQVLSGHPQPIADDETVVVPIFGRGRAMDVLTSGEIDEVVVEESTRFLCGACSCQVKQGNPGFDLLLDVDWDDQLWGTGERPAELPPTSETEHEVALVAIPPGQSPDLPSAEPSMRQPTSSITVTRPLSRAWIAAIMGVVVTLGFVWWFFSLPSEPTS